MRLGSADDPFRWYISHPAKCGPLTSQFSRLPSAVRMNAPLRVPTRTRTLLMPDSSLREDYPGEVEERKWIGANTLRFSAQVRSDRIGKIQRSSSRLCVHSR